MNLPKLLVFASGAKGGTPGQDGGSGFQELVDWSRKNPNRFEIFRSGRTVSGNCQEKRSGLFCAFWMDEAYAWASASKNHQHPSSSSFAIGREVRWRGNVWPQNPRGGERSV